MVLRVRVLSTTIAVALLAGCSGATAPNPSTLPGASLGISVSPASVVANGTNTVTVSVTGGTVGSITASTSKGLFSNGQVAIQGSGNPATFTLVTCNEATNAACPGTAIIRAVDGAGVAGQASVTFTGSGGGGVTCTTCGATACIGAVCDATGHTCSSGSPSTCTTCPGGSVEICNDGIDNNCNGLVDCADPQCQPVGNAAGAICDARGHTCSVAIGGVSSCSVCSGNGGTPEAHETSCGDGKDNDCDGLVDCQDPDCAGLNCSPYGLTCDPVAKTCSVCPGAQNVESTCSDGIDNDCNGLIDCKDPSCQPSASAPGKTCGAFGKTCSSAGGGACECSGNGGAAEAIETSCGDGIDNDCNGKIDCEDTSCNGKSCDAHGSVGKLCTAGTCACPGGTAEICNDGIDNDCNGKIDCQDIACQPSGANPGAFCDAKGNRCSAAASGSPATCSVCSGNGGTAETHEVSCSDGKDNDCDGLIDCADPDCLGRACSTVNPAYVCVSLGGNVTCGDPSSQYSLVVVPARSRIPADGVAITTLTATLLQNGAPLVGKAIAFSSPLAGTAVSTPPLTDANGQTTVTFTSNDIGGNATVTATYLITPSLQVTGTTVIALPVLGQVNLLAQQHDILGVRSSGFQETSLITFQLVDVGNDPYPAGLAVSFAHQSLGGFGTSKPGELFQGSWIGLSASCSGSPTTCVASGTTDAQGRVSVLLTSGQAAGVVSVVAGATAGGLSTSGTASNIALVGAKASGAHITLDCTPKNVQAFANSDCNFSHFVSQIDCTVALADRFNNVLGVSTLVQFFTEAGTAGPAAYTPQYDPKKPPSAQTGLGLAVSYVRSDGKLPVDVTPFGGEFSLAYTDGCNNTLHNPRDGLVTIIAIVNGEEGFVDLNGNGDYDSSISEPFINMGEPYIDANDNGRYDFGEFFVDVNRNGVYDGPDTVPVAWDRDTVIWAETRVLFTGLPAAQADFSTNRIAGSQFYKSGSLPEPVTALPFLVSSAKPGPATSDSYSVVFSDGNFNPLAPVASYSISAQVGAVSARYSPAPLSPPGIGMAFTQQYCKQSNLKDVASGSDCANVCPSAPCFVVTNVGACNFGLPERSSCNGFGYGSIGTVVVTGGSNPDVADTVQATATIDGTSSSVYLQGANRP